MVPVMDHHPLALGTGQACAEAKYIPQIIFYSVMNKDTIEGYIMESTNKQDWLM